MFSQTNAICFCACVAPSTLFCVPAEGTICLLDGPLLLFYIHVLHCAVFWLLNKSLLLILWPWYNQSLLSGPAKKWCQSWTTCFGQWPVLCLLKQEKLVPNQALAQWKRGNRKARVSYPLPLYCLKPLVARSKIFDESIYKSLLVSIFHPVFDTTSHCW